MKKLAVITTHPIQYYAPVFKLLNQRKKIDVKVFYTLGEGAVNKLDHGFNKVVEWDIPLLEGYDFEWMKNTATEPGSHYFKGIVNPDGIERIKKYQPDAILIFGWAYNAHLKIIRYFSSKVPVYFRGDSTLLNELGGLKKALRYVFLKWVYKHINHAFYVGKNNRNYYKAYELKESQLSFAPHAIDSNRFEADRSNEAGGLRSSFSIGNNDILILYAGKFEPVKNVELLLSAFITLNRPNVHLLLAGNGPNENDLKEQADKSGAANVHFTGFKNQTYMPVLYQAADLFCLPSKSETWGLSINEAMACGKAVLASDKVGCAADLIEEERNGAVFISDNAGSLVEKLQQLTKDKAQLAKLGQQSKQIIKNWSFLHIAEAIENKLLNEAY
ncbi:glycosyltransferase family 4 protein [Mucilaginibacter sp. OK098]|uniref:glycosyltransferase family 4 protein n=1 Tax=Mucilaginibacter sp. OK098 TaxID=1855297 RepID=UPI000922B175|nr:glycosyltransferase family 4 protein [Mucilaginibacter sp. OK098]SHN23958.1 Glycosyltransferase involved in cell wall bisynthesis [Mucilaginibacter sp. OK098]